MRNTLTVLEYRKPIRSSLLLMLIFHAFVSDKIGAGVSRVSELNIIQIMFK